MRSLLIASAVGIGGGVAATLLMLVGGFVPLSGAGGRLADYLGLATGLIVIRFGSRSAAATAGTFGAQLAAAALLVTALSGVFGLGLYAEFAWWRPGILAERYARFEADVRAARAPAARVAEELARLASHRAEYLDAGIQALSGANSLFFFGMLIALYSVWRARTVGRWQRSRPGTPPA